MTNRGVEWEFYPLYIFLKRIKNIMEKIKCYAINKNYKIYYSVYKDHEMIKRDSDYIYVPENIIDKTEFVDLYISKDNNLFDNENECIKYEKNKMLKIAIDKLSSEYVNNYYTLSDFLLTNLDRLVEIANMNKDNNNG